MKKLFIILVLFLGLLSFVGCKDNNKEGNGNEPSVHYDVTEEVWNKEIKNYEFAKDKDSKLLIKIYDSILTEDELEPSTILYKDKLVFELTHIITVGNFTTYLDFSKEKFEGYQYYGLNFDHYVKRDEDIKIDDIFDTFFEDFKRNFSDVKFEDNKYVADVTNMEYDESGKAYYTFIDGRLSEFKIILEDELYFMATIEVSDKDIILPDVTYLDEMEEEEMSVYLTEMMKEFKSYGIAGADYKVTTHDHYSLAYFEYLRLQNEDDTYKDVDTMLQDLKRFIVDNDFSHFAEINGQVDSIDEYIWIGQFKNGKKKGIIIKIVPDYDKVCVALAVMDFEVLNMYGLKEYLEPRFLDEDYEFYFDGTTYIDNNDCILLKYRAEVEGEFEDLVNLANTCLDDYGLEWCSSGSSSNYHYDTYEKDNFACKINFINDGDDYIMEVTLCVAYDGDPSMIIEYGVDNPLFR